MSLYNLHYLEFMATSHDKFWSHPVAGDALPSAEGETLQTSVARDENRRRLERQIAALEGKIRKERQLNRRMEMNGQLRLLKKELGQA